MGPVEWAILLLLSVLWGGSFYFIAVALTGFPPFTLVTLRVGLAALALLGVMMVMGIKIPRGPVWRVYLVLGFINIAAPFSLIVWGQTHIASGLASILNAATPLFGVVVAHLFTRDEKMTPGSAVGVVVGFSGVAIMVGPEVSTAEQNRSKGRRKTGPFSVMRYAVLRVVPLVHRRAPRCFA